MAKERYKLDVGELDENGFLRIKIRCGRLGVLPYEGSWFPELGVAPEAVIGVLRDEGELFDRVSIASGEGAPIFIEHNWLAPELPVDSGRVQIGSLAGTPYRNGDFLESRAVITDQDAIQKIQTGELSEVSPGIKTIPEIRSGIWRDGTPYEAVQRDIRYNHFAFLPPGTARGGNEMAIFDKKDNLKGDRNMAGENDYIKIKTPMGVAEVAPHSEGIIVKLMDAADMSEKEVKTLTDQMGDLNETIKKLQELNTQIGTLTEERDKLKGEIEMVKAELDKVASPEAISEAATELVETQDVAQAVAQDALPPDWQKKSSYDLKKLVVMHHLGKRGRQMDAATIQAPFIAGAWEAIKEIAKSSEDKKNVPVSMAAMDSFSAGSNERSALERLGFVTEKTK